MPRPIRRFALLFVVWTAIALLFATQWYAYDAVHAHPDHYFVYVRWNIEQWYAWLVLSPFVLRLAARRPIDLRKPWRALTIHLTASVLVALIALSIQSVISHLLERSHSSFFSNVPFLLTKDVAMGIMTYWALTVLAQTLHFYKENGERRVRESQLEQQLAKAQLQVLQMQLHPHFLFNTLHAIGTLIREEPDAAEQMLLDLSSLLRMFLEQEASQQISLRQELHLVELYLSIQRIRFRDRLTVSTNIAPPALNCSVPSLILQPLVENAIVHGIAKNPGIDEVEIWAEQREGQLLVEVRNSNSILGRDVSPDGDGWGLGLLNTRQRLAQIYNGSGHLSIQPHSPRGVICRIAIPAEAVSRAASAEEALLSL